MGVHQNETALGAISNSGGDTLNETALGASPNSGYLPLVGVHQMRLLWELALTVGTYLLWGYIKGDCSEIHFGIAFNTWNNEEYA